ncbi:MAG: GAF domain-containing protein [Myxococcota bacterium]
MKQHNFLTIFESLPQPVIVLGEDNRMERLNRAAAELFDADPSRDDSWTSEHQLTFPWLDTELAIFAGSAEDILVFEKQIPTLQGPRTFEISLKRMPSSEGSGPGTTVFLNDITRRKAAEERTAAGEQKFRELFTHMPEGVVVYKAVRDGADFIFTDLNRSAEIIDSISRNSVLGRRVTELFPAIAEFGLLEVFERVWRTGVPEDHPAGLYSDGRIKGWRENYVFRLPGGEIVSVCNDITTRKQAEKALIREVGINTAIAEISRRIIAGDDLSRISALVLRHARLLTGSPLGFTGWFGDTTGEIVFSAVEGETLPAQTTRKSSISRAVGGSLFIVNDPKNEIMPPGLPRWRDSITRLIAAPAVFSDELLGQVVVANAGQDYTGDDVETLERLSSFYAIAIRFTRSQHEREVLIHELQEAIGKVKTLSGLLPICSSCKQIRDDKGYWHQVEVYVRNRTDAQFSHGICPDCMKKLYPDLFENK